MKKAHLFLVCLIVCLLFSCKTIPNPTATAIAKPESKIDFKPVIELKEGVANLETKITQLQNTVTENTQVITHNNALDEQRRLLKETQERTLERERSSHGLLVVGLILFAFMVQAPINLAWRSVIMIVSICCITSAYLLPFFFSIG